MDKMEELELYQEMAYGIERGKFLREGVFKDYIGALKKHKTAVMDTDLIDQKVADLKGKLDDVITKWISENNSEIVAIISAQPQYDSEATSETASALRKSYGALVNMDLDEDQEMARVKAKVVVQEIKREIINTSLDDITSKYSKI